MTLIVGIKCSDGVVIGSDSGATIGSLGQEPIKQPITKIEVIGSNIIFGMSGPVGLAQRFTKEVEANHGPKHWHKKEPHILQDSVRDAFLPHIQKEVKGAEVLKPMIGNEANIDVITQSLIAIPLCGVPYLFEFDQQCYSEIKTDQLPFAAIGSGKSRADPFLAFIKSIFWYNHQLPNIAGGTFATMWTIKHVVKTDPRYISEPVQIATLEKDNNDKWKASIQSDKERNEVEESILRVEKHLRGFELEVTETVEGQKIADDLIKTGKR